MPALETLILDRQDGIGLLTLNRPQRLNAMNGKMFEELADCLEELAADRAVRCLVLKGAGRAFCSGADIIDLPQEIDVTSPVVVRRYLKKAGRTLTLMLKMEKPIIAQVHGPATGGGCNLALAADIVIAAEDAVFNQIYVQRGIVPDLAGLYLLPRLVGLARARELLLLGDDISAVEAARIGLISRAVPLAELESTVMALAQRFVAGSDVAIGLTKAGINVGLEGGLEAVLDFEASAEGIVFQTEYLRAAFRAFAERRKVGRT